MQRQESIINTLEMLETGDQLKSYDEEVTKIKTEMLTIHYCRDTLRYAAGAGAVKIIKTNKQFIITHIA